MYKSIYQLSQYCAAGSQVVYCVFFWFVSVSWCHGCESLEAYAASTLQAQPPCWKGTPLRPPSLPLPNRLSKSLVLSSQAVQATKLWLALVAARAAQVDDMLTPGACIRNGQATHEMRATFQRLASTGSV